MGKLFIRKSVTQLLKDAEDPLDETQSVGFQRHLTGMHLTLLGVGAIIGAGIFSLSGLGAANYAGPGIVYSFVIAGVLCAFAGVCYAEMASMVPLAGSAYTYSYATMGEFVAWIIGWDLVLEYTFGAVTVASSWSGYLISLITKTMGVELGDTIMRFTKGPWEMVTLADGSQISGIWNLPASLIGLVVAAILYRGIKESAIINNIIVAVKVMIILLFIILGWAVIDTANWIANSDASGLWSLIPPTEVIMKEGREFMRFGWTGVLTGAGIVFFAYIGFDSISTTAQECKNPRRDLPIGILASLVICTTLYILMALVMTGVVHYTELGVSDPVAVGIDRIITLREWGPTSSMIFTFAVKMGALTGLTSVILVLMMAQSRIFYAMSRDGLLPWFKNLHPKYQTPHIATVVTGLVVAIFTGVMPITVVGELVSIGTLLAFVVVCIGIPLLRISDPEVPRGFKVPFAWVTAPVGAAACIWVMSFLPADTWLRLLGWLALGFVVYFTYGVRHSTLRNKQK